MARAPGARWKRGKCGECGRRPGRLVGFVVAARRDGARRHRGRDHGGRRAAGGRRRLRPRGLLRARARTSQDRIRARRLRRGRFQHRRGARGRARADAERLELGAVAAVRHAGRHARARHALDRPERLPVPSDGARVRRARGGARGLAAVAARRVPDGGPDPLRPVSGARRLHERHRHPDDRRDVAEHPRPADRRQRRGLAGVQTGRTTDRARGVPDRDSSSGLEPAHPRLLDGDRDGNGASSRTCARGRGCAARPAVLAARVPMAAARRAAGNREVPARRVLRGAHLDGAEVRGGDGVHRRPADRARRLARRRDDAQAPQPDARDDRAGRRQHGGRRSRRAARGGRDHAQQGQHRRRRQQRPPAACSSASGSSPR